VPRHALTGLDRPGRGLFGFNLTAGTVRKTIRMYLVALAVLAALPFVSQTARVSAGFISAESAVVSTESGGNRDNVEPLPTSGPDFFPCPTESQHSVPSDQGPSSPADGNKVPRVQLPPHSHNGQGTTMGGTGFGSGSSASAVGLSFCLEMPQPELVTRTVAGDDRFIPDSMATRLFRPPRA